MAFDEQEDEVPTAVRVTSEMSSPLQLDTRALGQILLREGKVSEANIADALRMQAEDNGRSRIGEILVRNHVVTVEDVLAALAWQLDLPFVKELRPEDC